jgi:hypothetical protein
MIKRGVCALQTLGTKVNIIAQHPVRADSRVASDGWRKRDGIELAAGLRVRQKASACKLMALRSSPLSPR